MKLARCRSQRKMTELPILPENILASSTEKVETLLGIDLVSQVQKSLSVRSPFDYEDALAPAVINLPASQVLYISKCSDNRKKRKRTCFGMEPKPSKSEKPNGFQVWVESEEYFREVALDDLGGLLSVHSSWPLELKKCFSIPLLENGNGAFSACKVCVVKEEEDTLMSMEIDNVNTTVLSRDQRGFVGLQNLPQSSGIESLLGCRNKIYLASMRPSKKRKLLGSGAGLDKLLVAGPVEGDSTLCHYCNFGDTNDALNRLLVCGSCNVKVHQRCYGVRESVDETWFCSWCKHKSIVKDSGLYPCVLCPLKGGALKPVYHKGSSLFAHLFCSQWMPEVYVEDIGTMESVMNVDGIKETRGKLKCYLCKVRHGMCVRCTNGKCRTSFHPACAREARHKMEIWGKFGCDTVELRAFCSKHSEAHGKNTLQLGETSVSIGFNPCVVNDLPVTSTNKLKMLKLGHNNADRIAVQIEKEGTNSNKLETVILDTQSICPSKPKNGDVNDLSITVAERNENVAVNPSVCLWVAHILKQLIERGRIDLKEVALGIGAASDLLAISLEENSLVPEHCSKILQWLRTHAHMGASKKNLKVNVKPTTLSKEDFGSHDGFTAPEPDIPVVDRVKSVPSQRILENNSLVVAVEFQGSLGVQSLQSEGICVALGSPYETWKAGDPANYDQSASLPSNLEDHCSSVAGNPFFPNLFNTQTVSTYIHPFIGDKLMQIQPGVLGSQDRGFPTIEASSSAGIFCGHQNEYSSFFDGTKLELLDKSANVGILDLSPEDEVEGELVYLQHRLLRNAFDRKKINDDILYKVVKGLPMDIAAARDRRWDAVLSYQYLSDVREAKKIGRKEGKHKESQVVLAATTAAAAASSRNSSFRNDSHDEPVCHENPLKLGLLRATSEVYSPLMPRAKETFPRMAVAKVSSEKHYVSHHAMGDFSKEHTKSCDVCSLSETILNPILVCSGCKVSVHLDCYRSVKDFAGPWYCELCESLKCYRGLMVNFWEKSNFVAECGLCGGTTGAFRKSTDGQWIHAFCAELVLESAFKRGQVNPVEGMEMVSKGKDVCNICHQRHGVCIKCNFGHCQSKFHPTCARSLGLYITATAKTNGSGCIIQHKAYCKKHSVEQRAKVETRKHGVDKLSCMKQIRVELERLRLLCERIFKREKLKRELITCSLDILASKISTVPFSLRPNASSESATTSLKGHNNDEYCFTFQRSDDLTMDNSVSSEEHVKLLISMENDQKADDSSTSHHILVQEPTEEQIPHTPSCFTSLNILDNGDTKLKLLKGETFQKELIMTSDEASMKNQRLPKGYVYVPIACLPKQNQIIQDENP